MALLGTLSVIQAWFIPGFLFILFFKKIKILDNLVLSVPLSLVLNYILVYFLVCFKIYNQQIFLFIIFFQIILILLVLFKRYKLKTLINKIDIFFSLDKSKHLLNINISLVNFLILFLFIVYFYYAINNLGRSMHLGDPIEMWNAWAISWSKNIIPIDVEYPQAVPILYSISYVLLNSYEIEFFSRATCLIYPIWIFIIFFRLIYIFPNEKLLIKLTLIITVFFVFSIMRNNTLYIGFSDPFLILVSLSTGFIFIYNYIENKNTSAIKRIELKNIILISLIASAPAITKQMGLLISFVFPFFYFLVGFLEKKIDFKNTFIIFVIVFLICISWYIFPIYKYYQIDFETTKFGKLSTHSVGDKTALFRLSHGLHYLFWQFKYLVIILVLFSLKNRFAFKVFLLIVLPYFLIWSLFFGADNRNFLMVSPFLAFLLSVGLINLIKIFNFFNSRFFKLSKVISLIVFLILIALSINKIKNDDKIIFKSIESKKLRGNIEVNALLYNSLNYSKPEFYVFSIPDINFNYLPIIGEKIRDISCNKFDLKLKEESIHESFYLLINTNSCNIDELFKDKKYPFKLKKIFKHKNHIFYFIKN